MDRTNHLLAVGMSIIGVSKQQRPVQSEDESITLRVVLWDYDVVIYDRELIENLKRIILISKLM